jgi:hypothetical protein
MVAVVVCVVAVVVCVVAVIVCLVVVLVVALGMRRLGVAVMAVPVVWGMLGAGSGSVVRKVHGTASRVSDGCRYACRYMR